MKQLTRTLQESGMIRADECASLFDNAPKCDVRPSPLHGFGLFCRVPVRKGETIVDFSDPAIYFEVDFKDLEPWRFQGTKYQPLPNGRCLISHILTKNSVVNHSREPTAYLDFDRRAVVALRDLRAGEEVTTDYRLDPFADDARQALEPWL